MDKIQKLILDTYQEKPRHFTQILKRNKEVLEYLSLHSAHITGFLEKLYYAVYRDSGICNNGNQRPLKSFAGYSFCGKASVCECAKKSVSDQVSKSKRMYDETKKKEIQDKRVKTNTEKYGVTNTGLLEVARAKHAEFYSDSVKVSIVVERSSKTKEERYGDKNYNNRDKAIETCISKYGVKNTWLLSDDNQNPNLDTLRSKDSLMQLFPRYTVNEIAKQLSVHEQTVYHYLNIHSIREPYKSTFEKEIVFFLNELGVTNIVTNSRSIIDKELDIFLPDYNLAIEYNGVYWHHDRIPHITKSYHRDKFVLCEEKGIELFTIFSDSWELSKDVWKLKIKSKLGLSDLKVHARKTRIVKLSASDTKDILNNNHIQGYCPAQYCYGLEYNNQLVAVMTFSEKRAGIGKDRGHGSYELVRYVTACTVAGGASKLLSAFIKEVNPSVIVSYSDNRYSVGNLYKVLGFKLENSNPAGYTYYDPSLKKMFHRYKFAKHNLVKMGHDSKLTEFEITEDLGLLRIWDCGTKTWVLALETK